MKNLHTVFFFGRQAVCPACSGMITKESGTERYRCIDCNERYEAVELGLSDGEIICRSVGKAGA